MKEEWKLIDEQYQRKNQYTEPKLVRFYVSNLGRCKVDDKIVKLTRKQYYVFHGDKVHRWVAKMFIPNPDNKPAVDHIDTNIHNNRADNLRWVSNKENQNNPITCKNRKEWSNTEEERNRRKESALRQWEEKRDLMIDSIKKSREKIDYSFMNEEYRDKLRKTTKRMWETMSDEKREDMLKKHYKRVEQYTLSGEYIRTYESLKEAGKENNIKPNAISQYLNGYSTNGNGYIWKYAN